MQHNRVYILQPCDVGLFGPIKRKFSKTTDALALLSVCKKYTQVTKSNFSAVFREAFEHIMSLANIIGSFEKCGISPLNPDAIDKTKLVHESSIIEEAAGTSVIDFYRSPPSANVKPNPLVEAGIISQRLEQAFLVPEKPVTRTRMTGDCRVITADEWEEQLQMKKLAREEKLSKMEKAKEAKEKRIKEKEEKAREKERKNKEKENIKHCEKTSNGKEKAKKTTQRRSQRKPVPTKRYISDSSESDEFSDEEMQTKARNIKQRLSEMLHELRRDYAEESDSESSADEDNVDACKICHKNNPPMNKNKNLDDEIKWIGCDTCGNWYHMLCEGAKDEDRRMKDYKCNKCKTAKIKIKQRRK